MAPNELEEMLSAVLTVDDLLALSMLMDHHHIAQEIYLYQTTEEHVKKKPTRKGNKR